MRAGDGAAVAGAGAMAAAAIVAVDGAVAAGAEKAAPPTPSKQGSWVRERGWEGLSRGVLGGGATSPTGDAILYSA